MPHPLSANISATHHSRTFNIPRNKEQILLMLLQRPSFGLQKLFLFGLKKFGKGKWKQIAEKILVTKNHTQIASHAQKYFLRLSNTVNQKKRRSIHDLTLETDEMFQLDQQNLIQQLQQTQEITNLHSENLIANDQLPLQQFTPFEMSSLFHHFDHKEIEPSSTMQQFSPQFDHHDLAPLPYLVESSQPFDQYNFIPPLDLQYDQDKFIPPLDLQYQQDISHLFQQYGMDPTSSQQLPYNFDQSLQDIHQSDAPNTLEPPPPPPPTILALTILALTPASPLLPHPQRAPLHPLRPPRHHLHPQRAPPPSSLNHPRLSSPHPTTPTSIAQGQAPSLLLLPPKVALPPPPSVDSRSDLTSGVNKKKMIRTIHDLILKLTRLFN
ncbi:hypothetical protein Fmac_032241 [Flemingia macrophylla]|uniref:HTH myb-type domain-containing protein n=1 Tax=Flemingia macrophylla TaxID=520843 RepID=A0ABD1L5P5_9FABA